MKVEKLTAAINKQNLSNGHLKQGAKGFSSNVDSTNNLQNLKKF